MKKKLSALQNQTNEAAQAKTALQELENSKKRLGEENLVLQSQISSLEGEINQKTSDLSNFQVCLNAL